MAHQAVGDLVEHLQPDAHALEEDLFLVPDVILGGRLNDIQAPRDVVQRCVVNAYLVEGLRRRPQHGDMLGFPLRPAVRGRLSWRSAVQSIQHWSILHRVVTPFRHAVILQPLHSSIAPTAAAAIAD